MTPRATDWTLAALVAAGFGTGGLTLYAGGAGDAWVFAVHDIGGLALAGAVGWKLRRVWRRPRWSGGAAAGMALLALGSGVVWALLGPLYLGGLSLLVWHGALGFVLFVAVAAHFLARARPAHVEGRRDALALLGLGALGVAAWRLQHAASPRRFTGSYALAGADFPATSWVGDAPAPLPAGHRVLVGGHVRAPLALGAGDLDAGDELVATLDCTGGFATTQRWHGVALGRVLDRAGVSPRATHVRVVSRTGYRWSFPLEDARGFLLAVGVGGAPLTHGHGAPVRLVAPGRRGFQWVKWVERVQVDDAPDLGAPLSTLWSSFTPAGRGG